MSLLARMSDKICTTYSSISAEFDCTRYKPWPCVIEVLNKGFNCGSKTIFEAGCGNGKNLLYAKELGFKIVKGSDLCPDMVAICGKKDLSVVCEDVRNKVDGFYDIVLSIAVLHHISSEEDRLLGVKQLVDACAPGGTVFFTVWSYETLNAKKPRQFKIGDNLVPWRKKDGSIIERYYYVYTQEEIEKFMELFALTYTNNTIKYRIEWQEQNWCVTINHK